MQKSKHKKSKNKKLPTLVKTVGEHKLRPKNERYTGQLYFLKVSATLDYKEVCDHIRWYLS